MNHSLLQVCDIINFTLEAGLFQGSIPDLAEKKVGGLKERESLDLERSGRERENVKCKKRQRVVRWIR